MEKAEEEVQPFVNIPQEAAQQQYSKPPEVKVDAKDMEAYKSRIARWLSGK